MTVRNAKAVWQGDLKTGNGRMTFGGRFDQPFSFGTRFENGEGSNPEELIGAALAGCFSMALSAGLGAAGFAAKRIESQADVHLEKSGDGFRISRIQLRTAAEIPGIENGKFQEIAEATKKGCPVSQALSATPIQLEARLI